MEIIGTRSELALEKGPKSEREILTDLHRVTGLTSVSSWRHSHMLMIGYTMPGRLSKGSQSCGLLSPLD